MWKYFNGTPTTSWTTQQDLRIAAHLPESGERRQGGHNDRDNQIRKMHGLLISSRVRDTRRSEFPILVIGRSIRPSSHRNQERSQVFPGVVEREESPVDPLPLLPGRFVNRKTSGGDINVRRARSNSPAWTIRRFSNLGCSDEKARMLEIAQRLRTPQMYAALALDLNTGLRDKELREIRWQQIDLIQKKTLTVGKSKTDAGTGRVIPLNVAAIAAPRSACRLVHPPVQGVSARVVRLNFWEALPQRSDTANHLVQDCRDKGPAEGWSNGPMAR
jgi:hypothetical protein